MRPKTKQFDFALLPYLLRFEDASWLPIWSFIISSTQGPWEKEEARSKSWCSQRTYMKSICKLILFFHLVQQDLFGHPFSPFPLMNRARVWCLFSADLGLISKASSTLEYGSRNIWMHRHEADHIGSRNICQFGKNSNVAKKKWLVLVSYDVLVPSIYVHIW